MGSSDCSWKGSDRSSQRRRSQENRDTRFAAQPSVCQAIFCQHIDRRHVHRYTEPRSPTEHINQGGHFWLLTLSPSSIMPAPLSLRIDRQQPPTVFFASLQDDCPDTNTVPLVSSCQSLDASTHDDTVGSNLAVMEAETFSDMGARIRAKVLILGETIVLGSM